MTPLTSFSYPSLLSSSRDYTRMQEEVRHKRKTREKKWDRRSASEFWKNCRRINYAYNCLICNSDITEKGRSSLSSPLPLSLDMLHQWNPQTTVFLSLHLINGFLDELLQEGHLLDSIVLGTEGIRSNNDNRLSQHFPHYPRIHLKLTCCLRRVIQESMSKWSCQNIYSVQSLRNEERGQRGDFIESQCLHVSRDDEASINRESKICPDSQLHVTPLRDEEVEGVRYVLGEGKAILRSWRRLEQGLVSLSSLLLFAKRDRIPLSSPVRGGRSQQKSLNVEDLAEIRSGGYVSLPHFQLDWFHERRRGIQNFLHEGILLSRKIKEGKSPKEIDPHGLLRNLVSNNVIPDVFLPNVLQVRWFVSQFGESDQKAN